jgi:hypothetical protein
VPHVAPPRPEAHVSFWVRELPFTLVLILTIAGVAYTSFSKKPIVGYWEILAPIIALVCVAAGWQEAGDKNGRLRLIVTQALHWFAFLLVMNLMLLRRQTCHESTCTPAVKVPSARRVKTDSPGLIMALGIPAIAWIENSALLAPRTLW